MINVSLREYFDDKIDPIAADVREIKEQLILQNGRLRRVEQRVAVLWFVAALFATVAGSIIVRAWY